MQIEIKALTATKTFSSFLFHVPIVLEFKMKEVRFKIHFAP